MPWTEEDFKRVEQSLLRTKKVGKVLLLESFAMMLVGMAVKSSVLMFISLMLSSLSMGAAFFYMIERRVLRDARSNA